MSDRFLVKFVSCLSVLFFCATHLWGMERQEREGGDDAVDVDIQQKSKRPQRRSRSVNPTREDIVGFRFLSPQYNRVAGMARPFGPLQRTIIPYLVGKYNIGLIISLSSPELDSGVVRKISTCDYACYDISIGGVPNRSSLVEILARIDVTIAKGMNVVVHCDCGLGRTGLVLAALTMVKYGESVENALRIVRISRGPEAIDPRQEVFLREQVAPHVQQLSIEVAATSLRLLEEERVRAVQHLTH